MDGRPATCDVLSKPPPPPLVGVRVLDLGRVLSGPFCAALLADLGAEVIKVEPPEGDDSRLFGPFVDGECAYFRLVNRGKLGLTLDLRAERDRELLRELARRCDVLIENFRPGTLDRLGLDGLERLNPRLIVLSISGFGQTGPLADRPAYDLIAQAFSGLMSVTGWSPQRPTRCGISLGDVVPALYGALAVVAALRQRDITGCGQRIDLAMVDCLVAIMESVAMRALHSDEEILPCGNDHAQTAPLSTYAAADGEVAIGVSNDRLFGRLATALGRRDWLEDPRFMPYAVRCTHARELREELERALCGLSVREAVAALERAGVPVSPVQGVREALAHPQLRARGMVVREADGFETIASPIRLTGCVTPNPAPRQGEHQHLIERWLAEGERAEARQGAAERPGGAAPERLGGAAGRPGGAAPERPGGAAPDREGEAGGPAAH
ncbi:MAG TPA: CoA transferase [Solirubrobacteraceae bacterium]|nr:CoA transferase [Solirubrobacteraceae bacterium]